MELKPCPFCGSETVCAALLDIPYDPRRCYVLCQQCGARGPVFNGHEKVAVVEAAWNRRAAPAPEQSDRERAETLYRNGTEVLDGERFPAAIASLLAEVRAEERERCAEICQELGENHMIHKHVRTGFLDAAAAIRGSR